MKVDCIDGRDASKHNIADLLIIYEFFVMQDDIFFERALFDCVYDGTAPLLHQRFYTPHLASSRDGVV